MTIGVYPSLSLMWDLFDQEFEQRQLDAIENPYFFNGESHQCGFSDGFTIIDDDQPHSARLLKAGEAMTRRVIIVRCLSAPRLLYVPSHKDTVTMSTDTAFRCHTNLVY